MTHYRAWNGSTWERIPTRHEWYRTAPTTLLRGLAAHYGRITLLCWEDLHTPGQEHCHRQLLARLVAGETKHALAMEASA